MDGKGLILTNQHVVGNSEYLAVQFDRTHKIVAKLIAADPQKDVALLSVNMAALPNASSAPLYRAGAGRTPVQEGERVFTIGSPLSLDKIITTGIVSKVDLHTIMSDININPGSSIRSCASVRNSAKPGAPTLTEREKSVPPQFAPPLRTSVSRTIAIFCAAGRPN